MIFTATNFLSGWKVSFLKNKNFIFTCILANSTRMQHREPGMNIVIAWKLQLGNYIRNYWPCMRSILWVIDHARGQVLFSCVSMDQHNTFRGQFLWHFVWQLIQISEFSAPYSRVSPLNWPITARLLTKRYMYNNKTLCVYKKNSQ